MINLLSLVVHALWPAVVPCRFTPHWPCITQRDLVSMGISGLALVVSQSNSCKAAVLRPADRQTDGHGNGFISLVNKEFMSKIQQGIIVQVLSAASDSGLRESFALVLIININKAVINLFNMLSPSK